MELKINYVTPIPAKRVSENGEIDLRIASKNCTKINVSAFKNDTLICDFGYFSVDKQLKVNSIKIKTKGIFGKIDLVIYFLNNDNKVEETVKLPYEIIKSIVHGTQLLDGCWISLYHWSDDEARYFNHALKNLDSEGFKQQIYSMHNIGITGVIIQNVFDSPYYVGTNDKTIDTYDGKAFYNSELYSGRVDIRCEDPIEAILTAADECDMAVFPGVGLFAWFDFSPESLEWHKKVTLELHNKYGHHKSFYGWYISEEMFGSLYFEYPPVAEERWTEIRDFFKEYKSFIDELTPTKPVALAPNNIHMDQYREPWYEIMKNIDILIPFAFARSENNISQIIEMTKKADTHFWVDMEIFKFPFDEGLRPKEIDDLVKEIRVYDQLEQCYGYQFTGLMNEPGKRMNLGLEETEVVYEEYQKYYKDIVKE